MTLKAATGAWAKVPSKSHRMYALPLLHEMVIIGLKYLARIFQLSAFSIDVLRTRMRSPLLKLKSAMVAECSHSKRIVAQLCSVCTQSLSWARSPCHFWRAIAQCMMRSVDESNESGGGSR